MNDPTPALILASDEDTRFQFAAGANVYVRGWGNHPPAKVTQRLLHLSEPGIYCPHYLVVDADSTEWRVSQLELGKEPITPRKT